MSDQLPPDVDPSHMSVEDLEFSSYMRGPITIWNLIAWAILGAGIGFVVVAGIRVFL